jgi:putative SOS response-associated peptidase YedK
LKSVRFLLFSSGEAIAEAFGRIEAPELQPRFNVAPSQPFAVVRVPLGGGEPALLKWGLVSPPCRGWASFRES